MKRALRRSEYISNENMTHYDYNVKIILLGDYGVGKSTLMNYLGKQKEGSVRCCCARSNRNGYVEVEVNRNDKCILARLTDTGGQERYRSLTSSYYRGAHGCILMYDVTREETFHNIQNWSADLETYGPVQHVSSIMVGNKCMSPEREVTRQRGDKHAEHLELPYTEIDVVKNYNVIRLFEKLIDNIMEVASRKNSLALEIKPLSLRKDSKESLAPENSCCSC
ncbi:uncharacterized protein [Haliotis cracherodii]|uniref:uncharacterized protein n=1 Tax=Haliotis cracherodii TaxID=6455 RepID=UPI0039E90BB9